jgi:hypothetical protein
LADKVEPVLPYLERFLALAPALATLLHSCHQNASRTRYGPYRHRGDFIGSGALKSAGQQLAAARIKGPGLRWHIAELTSLLTLRGVLLEPAWPAYWASQAALAA